MDSSAKKRSRRWLLLLASLLTACATPPTPSASACPATVEAARTAADAFATVFTDCQGRYADVAAKADGHASDVRTLEEAWPQ